MITIRKSKDRGYADHGWLQTRHTFSFADYYDHHYMGFSVIRVINEDRIQGGTGFGTHAHNNMEILSYVIKGELLHKDSMGTETIIKPGEVQRMSAGTGVQHSEYNHLPQEQTHFLQIWILPEKKDLRPSYAQKSFDKAFASGELVLVASKNGNEGSITLHQDVNVFACKANRKIEKNFKIITPRNVWIQVIIGPLHVDNQLLESGDGAAIQNVNTIALAWEKGSEFLLFDLPI